MSMEKVTVPCGKRGDWQIKPYEITMEQARFETIHMTYAGHGSRAPVAGLFTVLYRKGGVIMSDTPAEMNDHRYFVHRAKGNILINGLGLGVVVHNLLLKEDVKHITIIEISEDLIDLVGEHYQSLGNGQITIIHADALIYASRKGECFDAVWHDIWPTLSIDNISTMSTLHRRYGRRLAPDGFQDSWCREQIKDMQKRERAFLW